MILIWSVARLISVYTSLKKSKGFYGIQKKLGRLHGYTSIFSQVLVERLFSLKKDFMAKKSRGKLLTNPLFSTNPTKATEDSSHYKSY